MKRERERNVDADKLRGWSGEKGRGREREREREGGREGGRASAREGDMEASVNIFTQAC